MHLLYTGQTPLFLLSYRAHALCANIPFKLTRLFWPSCHSDMGGSKHVLRLSLSLRQYTFLTHQTPLAIVPFWYGGSRHGWGFSLRTKWYPSSPNYKQLQAKVSSVFPKQLPNRLKIHVQLPSPLTLYSISTAFLTTQLSKLFTNCSIL